MANRFKDFGIKPKSSSFVGDKIKISKVFNIEIVVLDYKIDDSNQKESSKCLTLQIEKDGVKRIIFSGSTNLMNQIELVPKSKFPFTTTIVMGINDRYEFT